MTELEVITTLIDEYRNDILKHENERDHAIRKLNRKNGMSALLMAELLEKVDKLDALLIEKTMRILALARASRMIERALEAELNN